MVTRLRQELGDETSPYIWSDTYLTNLIIEANDWYSRLYPRKAVAHADVATGQRTFDVPEGAYAVVGVECPPGNALPEDSTAYTSDPTPFTGPLRQAYAIFGGTLYLRNSAAGKEVGASHLAMLVLQAWDRPDPVEPWNGPAADVRLLVLWAAREAWLWHDGQTQRLQRKVGAATQVLRFGSMLDEELRIRARRSAFTSRTMEVER
jgi:hypothetical protein